MTLFKHKKFIFLGIGVVSVILATLGSSIINAGELRISPYSGTIYKDCYQAYEIYAETDSFNTLAIDTKIILGNDFSLNPYTASGYQTYITGGMSNLIYPFATGTATEGSQAGSEYVYINTSQSTETGGSIHVITLYLKADATADTSGYIDFYRSGGWNGDDSNITSGTNNYTQIVDILTTVTSGEYYVTGYDYCPSKPYIVSGSYDQWVTYATATGKTTAWTSVMAGPHYLDLGVVDDTLRNERTNSNGWTVWTNTAVQLSLTGNEGIQMISVQMYDDPNIEPIGDVSSGRDLLRQFSITGNIHTGFITFDNIIMNDGNTYLSGDISVVENRYTEGFNIDVFWIDTVIPNIVTGTYSTGRGYAYVPLSGHASNGDAGWHYTGLIVDDEFTIYKFSGYNTLLYGYNTTTGYNSALINNNGGLAGTGFTMVKTIYFTQTRSGDIYYTDRAGNTGSIFVEVEVKPQVLFTINAIPAFRDNSSSTVHGRSGYATEADIWIAYKEGADRLYTHNSALTIGHEKVNIDHTGTGTVRMVPPGSGKEYLVTLKATGMLAVGFTGIRTNDIFDTGTNYFNFTSGTDNEGTINGFYPEATYNNINYLKGGDAAEMTTEDQYDRIDNIDLTIINGNLSIGVFDGPIKNDRDLNNVINAVEQSIVIQWDSNVGFIEYYTIGSITAIDGLYKTGFQSF